MAQSYRAQVWTTSLLFNVCCWGAFVSGFAAALP
jgi:hypothetical protein